jgi:hypothetical protein
MRSPRSRRSAVVVLALLVVGALAACQPTGHPRCDALTKQVMRAESFGYRIRCDASFPGTSNEGRSVLGWTDHDAKTLWIWPSKITDDRVLRKIAWHEIGHVAWDRQGRTGTQEAEERWADGYAYCAEPIKGVSYSSRPTSCAPYQAR